MKMEIWNEKLGSGESLAVIRDCRGPGYVYGCPWVGQIDIPGQKWFGICRVFVRNDGLAVVLNNTSDPELEVFGIAHPTGETVEDFPVFIID